jgi:hypothetical protein
MRDIFKGFIPPGRDIHPVERQEKKDEVDGTPEGSVPPLTISVPFPERETLFPRNPFIAVFSSRSF